MILAIIAPILLIHGYGEDAHVWDSWLSWFKSDHLNGTVITFSNDDQCGSVIEHATELAKIIHSRVNIIAHSKGGLEARWFISHYPDKVANLIMIGTPNKGTEAAYFDLTGCGGSDIADLQPESNTTKSINKPETNYFTIAGNESNPCYFMAGFRYICYSQANDGLVTVESAQSNYTSLGIYPYSHEDLLSHKDVYERVLPLLR